MRPCLKKRDILIIVSLRLKLFAQLTFGKSMSQSYLNFQKENLKIKEHTHKKITQTPQKLLNFFIQCTLIVLFDLQISSFSDKISKSEYGCRM